MNDAQMWVFGYGSLIWNPGFPVAEAVPATAQGWRRRFCMRSIHHRGSVTAPGLVLALDVADGARCQGVALRVAPGAEATTLAELRERELISSAYLEVMLPITLSDNRQISALCYVIDRTHIQYCDIPREEQAQIIAQATGGRGPNRDYLWQTAAHLAALGLADPDLDWLAARVRAITGQT